MRTKNRAALICLALGIPTITASTSASAQVDLVAARAYLRTGINSGSDVAIPVLGQQVFVHVDYEVIGGAAPFTATVRAFIDGVEYCGGVLEFSPDSDQVIWCPNGFTATSGGHTVRWELDTQNEVSESNEANNTVEFAFTTGTSTLTPTNTLTATPTVTPTPTYTATAQTPWDVGDSERVGQLTIFGGAPLGARLGLPLAGGDLNGDGFADVILTPMYADSGPARERDSAGESVIILSSGTIAGVVDLATLPRAGLPPNAALVFGADDFDYHGTEVWISDVDGDGFDDAMIGAQQGDGPGNARDGAGEVAIIWGHAGIGGTVIDLKEDDGAAVTTVFGAEAGDRLGVWISAADVDGDGVMDAIFGADQVDGPDGKRVHAGATYIVYGGAALRAQTAIDLAAREVPYTIIHGIDTEDHSGCTVRGVDLNADGAAEVLIGAGLNRLSAAADAQGGLGAHASAGGDGPDNVTNNVGEAYVVFGASGTRPQAIDLRTPPASTAIIWGVGANDAWGEELFGGDFNGDGYGDIAVGALTAPGLQPNSGNAGQLALLLGSPALEGARIRLDQAPPGVTIFYGRRGSIAGDTAMLVDINADGKHDLILGSPQAVPLARVNAGIVDIFFGTDMELPATVDLNEPPSAFTPYNLFGAEAGDMFAYSMGLGDVDGDGVQDLIINAMGADGLGNPARLDRAGDAYVLSGPRVSEAAGRELVILVTPTDTATPTPTCTSTATPTFTNTATETPTFTLTETPTRTPTDSPTPTVTPTHTPTGTPTVTLTPTRTSTSSPTPPIVELNVGSVTAAPGRRVRIPVTILSYGVAIVATTNDLTYDNELFFLDPRGCQLETTGPPKELLVSALPTNGRFSSIRLFVSSPNNHTPIPDGSLYSCELQVLTSTPPGEYGLVNSASRGFGPSGLEYSRVAGGEGTVVVSLVGPTCASDCDGSGRVTIDELIRAVRISLAQLDLSSCISADRDSDGTIKVNELVSGVNAALRGCEAS